MGQLILKSSKVPHYYSKVLKSSLQGAIRNSFLSPIVLQRRQQRRSLLTVELSSTFRLSSSSLHKRSSFPPISLGRRLPCCFRPFTTSAAGSTTIRDMTSTTHSNDVPETSASLQERENDSNVNKKDADHAASPDGRTDSTSTMKSIQEGSCQMVYPADQDSAVFYNPVQVQNRDLSILMISLYIERRALRLMEYTKRRELKQQQRENTTTNNDKNLLQEQIDEYMKNITGQEAIDLLSKQQQQQEPSSCTNNGVSILDALAASGLRSMRYWKEIKGIHHITVNDLEEAAIERAHDNITINQLQQHVTTTRTSHGIRINHNDATNEMYNSRPIHPILKKQQQRQQQSSTEHFENSNAFAPYHVIDLDPYGSASCFLDAAVQAVVDGTENVCSYSKADKIGFLCITCTDMAALGGSHPETAFGRYYGSMPIPNAGYLQEMAIRILLYSVAVTAAKYGKTIRPVLSVGMNFYIRVFVEIGTDKAAINNLSIDHIGYVYQSTQCPSYHIVPAGKLGGTKGTAYQPGRMPAIIPPPTSPIVVSNNDDYGGGDNVNDGTSTTTTTVLQKHLEPKHIGSCQETGSTFKIGGPIWIGPMHDPTVVNEAIHRLKTKDPNLKHITTGDRIHGLLLSCQEEIQSAPLFYRLPDLSRSLNISTPPILKFKAAIQNAGYDISGYHKDPHAIKTNAPNSVIWDILREWVKLNPPKNPAPPNSIASKILSIPSTLQNIDFTIRSSSSYPTNNKNNTEKKISRFPMNPERNWGPKAAAKGYGTTQKNTSDMATTSTTPKRKQDDDGCPKSSHESNHKRWQTDMEDGSK